MDKQMALDMALKGIEKQFGKGAVMRLGDKEAGRTGGVHRRGARARS